jgi:hypothetical protein
MKLLGSLYTVASSHMEKLWVSHVAHRPLSVQHNRDVMSQPLSSTFTTENKISSLYNVDDLSEITAKKFYESTWKAEGSTQSFSYDS